MRNRSFSAFLVALLLMLGSNLAQIQGFVSSYVARTNLPQTRLFEVFFWIWAALSCVIIILGTVGAYQAIRDDALGSRYLAICCLLMCCTIQVDDRTLPWSAFALSITFGVDRFAIGPNFVGLALFFWLRKLRESAAYPDPAPFGSRISGDGA